MHACNPSPATGDGNWTWFLPGRVPTLIDAGTGDERHLSAVEKARGDATLAQVIVTHGHGDHASGVVALTRRMPGVRCLKMPWPGRDGRWTVEWTAVRDGDLLAAGDTELRALHTPGHAPDHLCLWHEGTRTLFGGDLAMGGSTVYIPASAGGDLSAYLASIDRVLALDPARILPGHGGVIENPASLLRAYRAHRRQREAQIIDLLREGASGADSIVARLYVGLGAGLLPRARETVEAHLVKLEREGRAIRRDGVWRLA